MHDASDRGGGVGRKKRRIKKGGETGQDGFVEVIWSVWPASKNAFSDQIIFPNDLCSVTHLLIRLSFFLICTVSLLYKGSRTCVFR